MTCIWYYDLNLSADLYCYCVRQIDVSNNVIKKYTKNMYKMPITLNLSRNKLKKLPPPKMKGPQIHKIDLSYNQLSQLPANFNNLQCMTRLDLSNNQLEAVSEQLGLTKYIRWLDLSHNLLVELPESFCALGYAIDELHVTHNQLTTLPQNVDNFKVSVASAVETAAKQTRYKIMLYIVNQ